MRGQTRSAILILLIVAMLVTACTPAAPPAAGGATGSSAATQAPAKPAAAAAGQKVEIKWLQWWTKEWGPAHEKLIKDFEAAHPNIKVTVIDSAYDDMSKKLNAAAATGDTGYDFYGTESGWLPGLVKQGYVEPLDPWLAKDATLKGNLTETALRQLGGTTYSLCLYMNVYQYAYNIDQFQAKGLKPPASWDEFETTLKALRNEGTNTYGMSMPLQDGGFIATRYMGYRLAQEGGRWMDANGKVAFNSPEGVAALTYWRNLYKQNLIVPGSMGENQAQMLEFLASGQVASAIDGPFIATKAKAVNPNTKMAFAPPWRAKTGGYQWACSGVAINAKSPNKDAVWTFMQYLYSDKTAAEMTKAISIPWATKAGMASLKGSEDPILKHISDFATQDSANNLLLPVLPESDKMITALKVAFQGAITGEKEPKAALDEAAKVWQESFDNFGK